MTFLSYLFRTQRYIHICCCLQIKIIVRNIRNCLSQTVESSNPILWALTNCSFLAFLIDFIRTYVRTYVHTYVCTYMHANKHFAEIINLVAWFAIHQELWNAEIGLHVIREPWNQFLIIHLTDFAVCYFLILSLSISNMKI